MKKHYLAWLLALQVFPVQAWAATYYVATTGSDSSATPTNPATPWRTIQKCANAMIAGDICQVADGTYSVSDGTTAVVNTSSSGSTANNGTSASPITLRSTNLYGAKIQLNNGSASGAKGIMVWKDYWIVERFEVTGGTSTIVNVGVDVQFSQGSMIRNNKIHNIGTGVCSTSVTGFAGIFLEEIGTLSPSSMTTIDRNLIYSIGRLRTGQSGCNLTGAGMSGFNDHGIYIGGSGSAQRNVNITNNVFYDNMTGFALQVYWSGGGSLTGLNFEGNTMSDHPAPDGATPPGAHIILQAPLNANYNIRNNISYNPLHSMINCSDTPVSYTNVTVDYNLTTTGTGGTNNTGMVEAACPSGVSLGSHNKSGTDPLFTSALTRDYTLSSSSPAKDAGVTLTSTTVDILGTTRPQGAAYDIGPYERKLTSTLISAPANLRVQ